MSNSKKCLLKYREHIDIPRLNKSAELLMKDGLAKDEAMISAAQYILDEYQANEKEILANVIEQFQKSGKHVRRAKPVKTADKKEIISDFGDKLQGAKKELWASYKHKLNDVPR